MQHMGVEKGGEEGKRGMGKRGDERGEGDREGDAGGGRES